MEKKTQNDLIKEIARSGLAKDDQKFLQALQDYVAHLKATKRYKLALEFQEFITNCLTSDNYKKKFFRPISKESIKSTLKKRLF